MPLINGHATCSRLKWERWCRRIDSELDLSCRRDNDLEDFLGDDAGAVEGMVEPEVGGERVVGGGGDDAVFEVVAGSEAEDADGFDANVLVGGSADDGRIGLIGDGAGEDVGGAAAGVSDVDERDFDGLEGAVVVEIEAGKLADAEFGADVDTRVDFLAGIAIGFEAVAGFEELDLGGVFDFLRRSGFFGGLLGSLLGLRERKNRREEKRYCKGEQEAVKTGKESQDGLAGSLGRGWRHVKIWVRGRCGICTAL